MQSENYKKAAQVVDSNKQSIIDYSVLDNNWQLHSDDDNITLHLREEPTTKLNISRCSLTIPKPLSELQVHFGDMTKFASADPDCIDSKVVEKFDDDFFIGYIANKGMQGQQGRDMCFAQRRFFEGDRVVSVSGNFDHPSAPVGEGLVRANTIFGGVVLAKIDDNTTSVVLLSCVDPCGDLPLEAKKAGAVIIKEKLKILMKNFAK